MQFGAIYVGGGDWEFGYAGGVLSGGTGTDPCLPGLMAGGVTAQLADYANGNPVILPTGDRVRMEVATAIGGGCRRTEFRLYGVTPASPTGRRCRPARHGLAAGP